MAMETIVVVAAIIGAFAFFGGILLYSDVTWDRVPARRRR